MATDGEENGRREKIAGNGERSGVADEMPGNGGAGNRAADERGGTVGGERCASVARNMTDDGLAVYIHFPYCRSRCPYCDFFRGILPREFDEAALVSRYREDIAYFARLCGKMRQGERAGEKARQEERVWGKMRPEKDCQGKALQEESGRIKAGQEEDGRGGLARTAETAGQLSGGISGRRRVTSVFFGGGTPSLLSPGAVEEVLEELERHFDIVPGAEISLEANPNTFEREKFLAFRAAGINRLSLGVQALNAADLKFLGRTHGVGDAIAAMELGAAAFPKFSIDLIYARPGQKWEDWQQEIDLALGFGLRHISLYELAIEEGTVFARKNVRAADEEMSLTLYNQTVSYLRSRGLERYEVSNFAASGDDESVHNLAYWRGGDYIGIGEGAHGRLRLWTDGGSEMSEETVTRSAEERSAGETAEMRNTESLEGARSAGGNPAGNMQLRATVDGRLGDVLTPEERAEELVMMGLRIKEGIDAERFYRACGIKLFDFLSKKMTKRLAQLDLLCYDDANIRLTDKGFPLLDEIILELVS